MEQLYSGNTPSTPILDTTEQSLKRALYEINTDIFGILEISKKLAEGKTAEEIVRFDCDIYGNLLQAHPLSHDANKTFFPGFSENLTNTIFYINQAYQRERFIEENLDISLETHEDFINYFKSFDKDTLRHILTNMMFLEVNRGCNSGCIDVCAIGAEKGIKSIIPFSVIEWLVDNYPQEIKKSINALYWASDLKYYKDPSGKDGVDLLLLFKEKLDIELYNSISIGLDDKHTINFLVRCLELGINIHRISVLGKLHKVANTKLLEKIQNLYPHLEPHHYEKLKRILIRRETSLQGSSFKATDNNDIQLISCAHTYLLRPGKITPDSKFIPGFNMMLQTPLSQYSKYGYSDFPVDPTTTSPLLIASHYDRRNDDQYSKILSNADFVVFNPQFTNHPFNPDVSDIPPEILKTCHNYSLKYNEIKNTNNNIEKEEIRLQILETLIDDDTESKYIIKYLENLLFYTFSELSKEKLLQIKEKMTLLNNKFVPEDIDLIDMIIENIE